jgi:hypothetical protein
VLHSSRGKRHSVTNRWCVSKDHLASEDFPERERES